MKYIHLISNIPTWPKPAGFPGCCLFSIQYEKHPEKIEYLQNRISGFGSLISNIYWSFCEAPWDALSLGGFSSPKTKLLPNMKLNHCWVQGPNTKPAIHKALPAPVLLSFISLSLWESWKNLSPTMFTFLALKPKTSSLPLPFLADKKGAFTSTKSCTFSVYTALNGRIVGPTKTAVLEPSPKAQPKMLARLELAADANIKWHLNCPRSTAPHTPQRCHQELRVGAGGGQLSAEGVSAPWCHRNPSWHLLPPVLAGWAEGTDWSGTERNYSFHIVGGPSTSGRSH